MTTIIGSKNSKLEEEVTVLNTCDIGYFTIKLNDPNQDDFLCRFSKSYMLLAVADGIGGLSLGSVAARTAVECLSEIDLKNEVGCKDLSCVFEKVKNQLDKIKQDLDLYDDLGTTLTAVLIDDQWIRLCHTGDSRLYIFSNGDVTFQTRDQSTSNEYSSRSSLNFLSDAIVSSRRLNHITKKIPRHGGESVVLMTDGVYKVLDNNQLLYLSKICKSSKLFVETVRSYLEMSGVRDDSTMIALGLR